MVLNFVVEANHQCLSMPSDVVVTRALAPYNRYTAMLVVLVIVLFQYLSRYCFAVSFLLGDLVP